MIIFVEAHLRPAPMAEIGDLEAEILAFRHQLNVLSASSALARGFSLAQQQGFFVIFSTL
jgi:hypothetical protein